MNAFPLVLYVAAAIAYAVHFARRDAAAGRLATALLIGGALAHTFVIGMATMEVRHVPFANPSRAVSTFVWLLALSYLYVEVTTNERAMGAFITPIVAGLQMIPTLYPGQENMDPLLDSGLFWIHVASVLFSYASFGLAGMLGLVYVLQFKEIKKKHLGYFYTRLPSLQILDAMNSRAVGFGWVFLTIGVAAGIVWVGQAAGANSPNVQAMSLSDPKIFLAAVIWGIFSFAVLARRIMGWSGRRAAWLSAAGFAIVLLNLVPVSYFLDTSHTFQ